MNPTAEILQKDSKYLLIQEIDFSSTVPFLMKYIPRLNLVMVCYFSVTAVLLVATIYLNYYFIAFSDMKWNTILKFTTFGFFIGAIPVIPVHEGIHGLACRLLGAKKIVYGVEWKQMMFYAAAHNFVMDRKQFLIVALSPFLLITGLFLSISFLAQNTFVLVGISAAFFHSTMCIGDFGLLSFFQENRGKRIFTYDNIEEKKTYFFEAV